MGTKNFIALIIACILLLFYSPILSFLRHLFGNMVSLVACIGIVVFLYTSIGGDFRGSKFAQKVGDALDARSYISRKERDNNRREEDINPQYLYREESYSPNETLVMAF